MKLAADDALVNPLFAGLPPIHFIEDETIIDSHGYVQYGARNMYTQVLAHPHAFTLPALSPLTRIC
jgi:hypothetical protein